MLRVKTPICICTVSHRLSHGADYVMYATAIDSNVTNSPQPPLRWWTRPDPWAVECWQQSYQGSGQHASPTPLPPEIVPRCTNAGCVFTLSIQ